MRMYCLYVLYYLLYVYTVLNYVRDVKLTTRKYSIEYQFQQYDKLAILNVY